MANYETINVQFMNQAFVEKLDQGLTKEASVAATTFVRQKLRELSFARKVMPISAVTANDLDRQLDDEPAVIVEKEPDSAAANIPFHGRPDVRYFTGERYRVSFSKIQSREFKKSKYELMTYRTDIQSVIQENSVKDLQKVEDENFYQGCEKIATDSGNIITATGGFTIQNLMRGVKGLAANQLPVGCILMTQQMYADLLTQPATQIGSSLASDLISGKTGLEDFFKYKIITTIKSDILPENRAIFFAPPAYLGQFYMLQDATVFMKTEADMITMNTYEAVGMGIGNTNAIVVVDF